MRKRLFPLFAAVVLLATYGLPVCVVLRLYALDPSTWWRTAVALMAPALFCLLFVAIAGACSLPFQRYIVAGRFARSLDDPRYFARRMYGLCWTAVYYCTPVYSVCLAIPALKWLLFRLFGYRGSMAFTIYPDTWIRDLPLLSFGRGAYISNRATLGTNIVLNNGRILVGPVTIGDDSCVGHLSMIGPGTEIGCRSEINVGSAIGINVRIGDRVRVGSIAGVDHGARVEAGVVIGTAAIVGRKTHVAAGRYVPMGARIGDRSELIGDRDSGGVERAPEGLREEGARGWGRRHSTCVARRTDRLI